MTASSCQACVLQNSMKEAVLTYSNRKRNFRQLSQIYSFKEETKLNKQNWTSFKAHPDKSQLKTNKDQIHASVEYSTALFNSVGVNVHAHSEVI